MISARAKCVCVCVSVVALEQFHGVDNQGIGYLNKKLDFHKVFSFLYSNNKCGVGLLPLSCIFLRTKKTKTFINKL